MPEQLTRDVVPYLTRINTQDYVNRMHSKRPESLHFSQRWATRILAIPGFDSFMGLIIVANLFVMIVETDRTVSEDDDAPIQFHWTDAFGWVALTIFVCELLLRMLAFQCLFWRDKANVFDFFIVALDAIFSLLGLVAGNIFPVSILRVFRLAKLARVSKVLRVFPELRLLLAGLISSVSAIFWGTLLLILCIVVWSMVAVLFIHPLNKTINYEGCDRCPRAYSSVMQATLTLWQQIVTGDSWGQASIPLIEQYPETILFFIPVFLSIGMAVMNLILGVVVSVAQQAKEELEEEVRTEKALQKLEQQSSLLELCKDMDLDSSGELSREEIRAGLHQPGPFQDCMQALNISEEDFEIAWAIMDADNSGQVSYKEFVNYLCTMRNTDQSYMVAYIKYYITWIRTTLLEQMERTHTATLGIYNEVEADIMEVEEREQKLEQREDKLEEAIMTETLRRLSTKDESLDIQDRQGIFDQSAELQERMAKNDRQAKEVSADGEHLHEDASRVERRRSRTLLRSSSNVEPKFRRRSGSSFIIDKSQDWVKQLCNDIDTLRTELRDILTDMNRKLGSEKTTGLDMKNDTIFKPLPEKVLGSGIESDTRQRTSRGENVMEFDI